MTFVFGFCSVLYGVGFGSGSCKHIFTFGFRFGSWQNLGSGSVVLAGFGFVHISTRNPTIADKPRDATVQIVELI